MLNIFRKNLLQNRCQRDLFRSTVSWLIKREYSILRAGNCPVYAQCNQFHTFGQLNRNIADDGKIHKEFEHYADDPKPEESIIKSIKQLAAQGRIDDAIAVYEKSKQHQNDLVTLTMINILVKAERLSAAKDLVVRNPKSHKSTSRVNALLCSIFDHLVRLDESNLDELNFFVENLVFKRKYIGRTVLEIIINGHLSSKNVDFDRILGIFERMANQFNETPLFQSIACELIKNDDTERLEWILDISKKVHGRANSLYNMAFALNACNRIDQARKIFVSLGIERQSERLEQHVEHLRLRRQTKLLENLLAATKDCVPRPYREQIYASLLELYAYKNANDDITRTCSAMDEEKILPSGQVLEKFIQIFKRNGINVPDSWQSTVSDDKFDGSSGDGGGDSEAKLESLLDANDLNEANELLLEQLQAGKSLDRKSLRYCLLKNAVNANVDIFQQLTVKLDSATKTQLEFHHYECLAYLNAKKCDEYLEMIRKAIEHNQNDLKTVATQLPLNLLYLIDSSADVYEQYLTIATQFADKGIIKPICISWTYNFLNNKNPEDNQLIWEKYLRRHGTILCKVFTKLVMIRGQKEKLLEFLNYDQLDKNRIAPIELGKSYSVLFDKLYYQADYDGIICELKKMAPILPIKYLKGNTVNRLKFGPSEFKEQFWCIVNNAK